MKIYYKVYPVRNFSIFDKEKARKLQDTKLCGNSVLPFGWQLKHSNCFLNHMQINFFVIFIYIHKNKSIQYFTSNKSSNHRETLSCENLSNLHQKHSFNIYLRRDFCNLLVKQTHNTDTPHSSVHFFFGNNFQNFSATNFILE